VTVKENLRLEQRREYMAAPVRADPIAEGGMRFTFPPYSYYGYYPLLRL
jgi:hypothetical protein